MGGGELGELRPTGDAAGRLVHPHEVAVVRVDRGGDLVAGPQVVAAEVVGGDTHVVGVRPVAGDAEHTAAGLDGDEAGDRRGGTGGLRPGVRRLGNCHRVSTCAAVFWSLGWDW
jgi:hypothetical protein